MWVALPFTFAGLVDAVLVVFFTGDLATALEEEGFFAFAGFLALETATFLATAVFLTGELTVFFWAGVAFLTAFLATALAGAALALVVLLLFVEDTFFFAVIRKEFSAGYGFNEGWQALQRIGEILLPMVLH